MKTMHKLPGVGLLFTMLLALIWGIAISPVARAQTESAVITESHPDAWPKEFAVSDGTTFTIYQPQFTTWDGLQLVGSTAVMVKPDSDSPKTYGSIGFTIRTRTDAAAQSVIFEKINVTHINFPSAQDKATGWGLNIASRLARLMPSTDLARLRENLDITSATENAASAGLRNEPPQILFSSSPALNITIDGDPQWRHLGDTSLQRVVNTRALLVRDNSRYMLHLWDGYLEAPSLNGPWKVAKTIPTNLDIFQKQLADSGVVDLLSDDDDDGDGEVASLKTTLLPEIYVTTKPTELVVSEGTLQWTPVTGTQLLAASNTNAYLFKDIASQDSYILISGRWFKSGSFVSWHYVPADKLPADFSRISDSSAQETVKASVAGTPQAEEAAIANTVPEVIRVDRVTPMENTPAYDNGAPELMSVPNTTLLYARNCVTPVFRTSDGAWFACENGAWFTANNAYGPWRVAMFVPVEIYKIPVGAPLHYVTYVRLQRYDDNSVWFSYTPGYYGTVVSSQGTVVYGTGYTYPAYVGTTIYVSYPWSYGIGFNACWNPWRGWYFGFSSGWIWSSWNYYRCRPMPPCWGPYRARYYPPRHVHASHHRQIVHPRINFHQPRRDTFRPVRVVDATRYNRHSGRPVVAPKPIAYDKRVTAVKARQGTPRPIRSNDRAVPVNTGKPVRNINTNRQTHAPTRNSDWTTRPLGSHRNSTVTTKPNTTQPRTPTRHPNWTTRPISEKKSTTTAAPRTTQPVTRTTQPKTTSPTHRAQPRQTTSPAQTTRPATVQRTTPSPSQQRNTAAPAQTQRSAPVQKSSPSPAPTRRAAPPPSQPSKPSDRDRDSSSGGGGGRLRR